MKRTVSLMAGIVGCIALTSDAGTAMQNDVDRIEVEALELQDLRISIDRLGLIEEKTQEIWQKLRSDERRGETGQPGALNYALRRTLWDLNALREDLCRDRFMVEKSCVPPYVPSWALESPKVIPSARELQKRESDLEDQIVPLWDAACERLRKIVTTDDSMYFCSIE